MGLPLGDCDQGTAASLAWPEAWIDAAAPSHGIDAEEKIKELPDELVKIILRSTINDRNDRLATATDFIYLLTEKLKIEPAQEIIDNENSNINIIRRLGSGSAGVGYECVHEGQTRVLKVAHDEVSDVLIEKEAAQIITVGEVYEAKSTLELLKSDSSRYKAELYWRLSLPISALLLVFLAIPLSFINPRSGRSVNIILALLLFVIYNNLLGVSHSIVSIGNTKILHGLWPVHLSFGTIAIYLFYRRSLSLPLFPTKFLKNK